MGEMAIIMICVSIASSAITALCTTIVTKRFVDVAIRKRILHLETEVEGLDEKLLRRTQRENSAKQHLKNQETETLESEALSRVNSRLESPKQPLKSTRGLHQGFYK